MKASQIDPLQTVPLAVRVKDILSIGITTFEDEDGMTGFVLDPKSFNLELIMLRLILNSIGHRMTGIGLKDEGDGYQRIITSFPWREFEILGYRVSDSDIGFLD